MVRYGLIGHRIGLKEKYIHFCANEWVPKFINCLKCLTTALAVARTFRSPCTRIFLSINQARHANGPSAWKHGTFPPSFSLRLERRNKLHAVRNPMFTWPSPSVFPFQDSMKEDICKCFFMKAPLISLENNLSIQCKGPEVVLWVEEKRMEAPNIQGKCFPHCAKDNLE